MKLRFAAICFVTLTALSSSAPARVWNGAGWYIADPTNTIKTPDGRVVSGKGWIPVYGPLASEKACTDKLKRYFDSADEDEKGLIYQYVCISFDRQPDTDIYDPTHNYDRY